MVRKQVLRLVVEDGSLGRFDRGRIIPFGVMDAGEKLGDDPFIRILVPGPKEEGLGGAPSVR